jgi:hypothetical protein
MLFMPLNSAWASQPFYDEMGITKKQRTQAVRSFCNQFISLKRDINDIRPPAGIDDPSEPPKALSFNPELTDLESKFSLIEVILCHLAEKGEQRIEEQRHAQQLETDHCFTLEKLLTRQAKLSAKVERTFKKLAQSNRFQRALKTFGEQVEEKIATSKHELKCLKEGEEELQLDAEPYIAVYQQFQALERSPEDFASAKKLLGKSLQHANEALPEDVNTWLGIQPAWTVSSWIDGLNASTWTVSRWTGKVFKAMTHPVVVNTVGALFIVTMAVTPAAAAMTASGRVNQYTGIQPQPLSLNPYIQVSNAANNVTMTWNVPARTGNITSSPPTPGIVEQFTPGDLTTNTWNTLVATGTQAQINIYNDNVVFNPYSGFYGSGDISGMISDGTTLLSFDNPVTFTRTNWNPLQVGPCDLGLIRNGAAVPVDPNKCQVTDSNGFALTQVTLSGWSDHGIYNDVATARTVNATNFTEARLNANGIQFVHDGSNQAPFIRLIGCDPSVCSAPITVTSQFQADAPDTTWQTIIKAIGGAVGGAAGSSFVTWLSRKAYCKWTRKPFPVADYCVTQMKLDIPSFRDGASGDDFRKLIGETITKLKGRGIDVDQMNNEVVVGKNKTKPQWQIWSDTALIPSLEACVSTHRNNLLVWFWYGKFSINLQKIQSDEQFVDKLVGLTEKVHGFGNHKAKAFQVLYDNPGVPPVYQDPPQDIEKGSSTPVAVTNEDL